jgi:hypothetical protein
MDCIIDARKKYLNLGLWGKPVIYYSVSEAIGSNYFTNVIVVTQNKYIAFLCKEFFGNKVIIEDVMPEKRSDIVILDGRAALITAESMRKAGEKVCAVNNQLLNYVDNQSERLLVDSENNFELALALLHKRNRSIWLKSMIQNRINEKKEILINYVPCSVCLIGHSQFDQWSITKLGKYEIRNCGISGITSVEYLENIICNGLINLSADKILILIGTNDIVGLNSIEQVANNICRLIEEVKKHSNAEIYYLESLFVNGRLDRDNISIDKMNQLVRNALDNKIVTIKTNRMNDSFGNLNYKYTTDGLHLNELGYSELLKIVEPYFV